VTEALTTAANSTRSDVNCVDVQLHHIYICLNSRESSALISAFGKRFRTSIAQKR